MNKKGEENWLMPDKFIDGPVFQHLYLTKSEY
jgi:hypothetical protein